MSRFSYLIICHTAAFLLLQTESIRLYAQPTKRYWQQEIKYKMDVSLDVNTNLMKGKQTMRYKNNSPDVLNKVFFHLYFNAFQPGSEMDVRSRTLPDPDPRVEDRILHLDADEIGFQRITKLTQNGVSLKHEVAGTILEVTLAKPLRPGQSATFYLEYDAQVPIQVRRSGRDNKEGIRYSMSQWYPKLCEYDEKGWHANPYIGREFYGIWGDFDVSLTLDAKYIVAASGILQNAKEIGHGYAPEPKQNPAKLTWHFIAQKVHDFVWAADPDFIHTRHVCADGMIIHTFHQETTEFKANWESLPKIMEEAFVYFNTHFGKYPYPSYSYIQAGDGGMEYPMATLITGKRSLGSLVGVSVHETLHSWYQMVLGFDESHFYWMDEGFTDYAETRTMNHLRSKGMIPGTQPEFPYAATYKSYFDLVAEGIEEPLSTHADHFETNTAYGIAAYVKGAVFLHQLEYIIGKPAFEKGMLDFYNAWKFKHPDDNDFIRVMEKSSGLELDWYREYMVNTTKSVDYAVDSVYASGNKTIASIARIGKFPMPVEVNVDLKNGTTVSYYMPLDLMRGTKKENLQDGQLVTLPDWNWVNPFYDVEINYPLDQIESITIDKSMRLADIYRENNSWPLSKS